jgi:hypothetical protein
VAQLSKEGLVRYSGGIKENANNLWSWTAPSEISEISILDIEQQKARNQKKFPFQIMAINAPMQYRNVDRNMLPDDGDDGDDHEKDTTNQAKNRSSRNSKGSRDSSKHGNAGFRKPSQGVRSTDGGNKHRTFGFDRTGRHGKTGKAGKTGRQDAKDKYLEDLSDLEDAD